MSRKGPLFVIGSILVLAAASAVAQQDSSVWDKKNENRWLGRARFRQRTRYHLSSAAAGVYRQPRQHRQNPCVPRKLWSPAAHDRLGCFYF